jgi:hypothetical protein
MPKFEPTIEPVFSKLLARKAIALEQAGALVIIQPEHFPEGVPVHADGSTVHDPKKPFVIFAVRVSNWEGHRQWQDAVDEHNKMIEAARAA